MNSKNVNNIYILLFKLFIKIGLKKNLIIQYKNNNNIIMNEFKT